MRCKKGSLRRQEGKLLQGSPAEQADSVTSTCLTHAEGSCCAEPCCAGTENSNNAAVELLHCDSKAHAVWCRMTAADEATNSRAAEHRQSTG